MDKIQQIKDDLTLWEKMDYPNVGRVYLIEENYVKHMIGIMEQQENEIKKLKRRD